MKIYNSDQAQELNTNELDFEKGYLKPDKKFVQHHEAVEARNAVYKDRVEKLPNGSTQVWKDLILPAVEAKEAYDEYEDIQVYVPYSAEELKEHRLTTLRSRRENLLVSFDKYKSNVDYGIEPETEIQHENMIAWYKDLLDLKEYAFNNIPERIKYYLEKSYKILDK